jgi:hypothetical protein
MKVSNLKEIMALPIIDENTEVTIKEDIAIFVKNGETILQYSEDTKTLLLPLEKVGLFKDSLTPINMIDPQTFSAMTESIAEEKPVESVISDIKIMEAMDGTVEKG